MLTVPPGRGSRKARGGAAHPTRRPSGMGLPPEPFLFNRTHTLHVHTRPHYGRDGSPVGIVDDASSDFDASPKHLPRRPVHAPSVVHHGTPSPATPVGRPRERAPSTSGRADRACAGTVRSDRQHGDAAKYVSEYDEYRRQFDDPDPSTACCTPERGRAWSARGR